MQLIDGQAIAKKIREEIKQEIQDSGLKPGLAVILVGADPASHLYVSLKEKACDEVGIHFEKYLFFASEPEEKIINQILLLNARPDIHGILVQLPLPEQYDADKIIQAIDSKKDADGFHPENLKLLEQSHLILLPVTTKAVATLIKSTRVVLTDKNAIILANSQTFAAPIKNYLENHGVPTEIIIYIPNVIIPKADILITAVGKPKIITADLIKDKAIVIDVGTSRINVGTEETPVWKTVGDVDAENLKEKTGFLTPVPGGVGPVTVATLLENVLLLSKTKIN